MIIKEWKKLFTNPLLIMVLVVIMLIPAMYSGLFLASMWDPYGELDKLPVAVVNLDHEVEYKGNALHIGDDLVDKFYENSELNFEFVSEDAAARGLRDGKYYMVITIPEDFSYKAATATDLQPDTMQLLYSTNPATNYVASKLSESAMTRIEKSLQESISATYINALIGTINDIGGDLQTAADGSQQLLDGQNQVSEGVALLTDGSDTLMNGAASLSSGANDLSNGANAINDASGQIADGAQALSTGSETLYNGAVTLQNGITSYTNGASALNDGIGTLHNSMPDLVSGANTLAGGAAQLHDGSSRLVAGFEGDNGALAGAQTLASGTAQLNSMIQNAQQAPLVTIDDNTLNGIASAASQQASAAITSDNQIVALVAAGLQAQYASQGAMLDSATANAMAVQYVQQLASATASTTARGVATNVASTINNSLPQSLGVYTQQIADGSNALNDGMQTIYQGVNTLDTSLATYEDGMTSLNDGITSVSNGVEQLYVGSNELINNNSALVNGASALTDGTQTLAGGASTLADGTVQLSEGAGTLANGASTLASGASTLSDGTVDLNSGIHELNDSLPELTDGTSELQNALQNGSNSITEAALSDANGEMMSNPVDAVETQITKVDNNGSAMAAYMMSVGLWVACLAFCLMYPLTDHDELKNGIAWWASKASVLLPIALIQGAVLILVLKFFLGFNPANLMKTVLVSSLASLAFMSIMYFFNAFLGKVGSFLMLLFMVLQLAGSAGTYPIELSGPLASALHKYVPFTYTVDAFRSTIGGGESIRSAVVVLVGITVVFTVLTMILFTTRSIKEKRNKESVHEWLESKGLA